MFNKKECVAMLLAGGQGSRLYALTQSVAKPAVPFGAKYRIIDFPLSNCINSGIDTVGVLTQYQPLVLNEYIGNGQPWDLDRIHGGVHVLPPYQTASGADWYSGTANAIYQNIAFVDRYDPEYVVVLSGDHIYKMDYNKMLEYHKAKNADATIAVLDVPKEEASRFGIMITDEDDNIIDFEEKPLVAGTNTVSIGVYVIRRRQLIELLETCANEGRNDFVRDILVRYKGVKRIYGYKMDSYWRNIGTKESYYRANMDFLKKDVRDFFFKQHPDIYSRVDDLPPAKYNADAVVNNSLIASGCIINGTVENSVIFKKVYIGNNCVIRNSIILNDVNIGDNSIIENCIVESRDTLRANTVHQGTPEDIKVIVEKDFRYAL